MRRAPAKTKKALVGGSANLAIVSDSLIGSDVATGPILSAVLSTRTFWTFVREFSPFGTYAGWTKEALVGWFGKPAHGSGIAQWL